MGLYEMLLEAVVYFICFFSYNKTVIVLIALDIY